MRLAVVGSAANETSPVLVDTWRRLGIDCDLMDATVARAYRDELDTVLARIDVLPTLDGVEPGLLELLWLERAGKRVLNPTNALLTVHDKLRTAKALARAGIPHPQTTHVTARTKSAIRAAPVVLKPRFGSWGKDVRLCQTRRDIEQSLDEFATRPWFRRHGVLLQEVIPSAGRDLRLLVAGRRVVGAIERIAAAGEWRTNISVGARKRSANPPPAAGDLAVAATAAVRADLVGVDLLPLPDGGYAVIELNGAADFDGDYSLAGGDVYADAAAALGFLPIAEAEAEVAAAIGAR
jgi:RimK family alpha-L-glutamate ligase